MSKACTSSNAAGARATRSPRWFVDRRAPPYLAMRGGRHPLTASKFRWCRPGCIPMRCSLQAPAAQALPRIDNRGQVGAWHISSRWPANPKPVTSVRACTPDSLASSAPILLDWHISSVASPGALCQFALFLRCGVNADPERLSQDINLSEAPFCLRWALHEASNGETKKGLGCVYAAPPANGKPVSADISPTFDDEIGNFWC